MRSGDKGRECGSGRAKERGRQLSSARAGANACVRSAHGSFSMPREQPSESVSGTYKIKR
eukprot:5123768-Pleurochrysis_carterae.AAC.1